jgi:hypothetical protein
MFLAVEDGTGRLFAARAAAPACDGSRHTTTTRWSKEMSQGMSTMDRDVMVAARLAAALVGKGDGYTRAVDTFEQVLHVLMQRGGTGRMISDAVQRMQDID